MRLSRDFRELLECFARHEVRFLIVGGWALAAHGHPRMTKDLDIWIWADSANADAVADRLDVTMGGLDVPFIGLEGLKQNKRSSGRPQDLVDIQILEGRDKPLR